MGNATIYNIGVRGGRYDSESATESSATTSRPGGANISIVRRGNNPLLVSQINAPLMGDTGIATGTPIGVAAAKKDTQFGLICQTSKTKKTEGVIP